MSLQEKLRADLYQAVKSGDKVRRSAIRMVLAEIKNAEIAQGPNVTLDDNGVLGALAKEARRRKESIEAFQKGGRQDLVASEEAELVVIQGYLPKSMSPEEIEAHVRKVIQETGASGPRDKSKVMPRLVAELKGKADGRAINEVVTRLLGG
jgi:uncharacterized protein YqeY